MEIIDAQIHQPLPPLPLDDSLPPQAKLLVSVEMAREAMDSIGVDAALVFARQDFMDACIQRYPDRFAGCRTLDYMADDLEEQVAALRSRPGMLAGRNFVGNSSDFTLRAEFAEGKLERLYVFAEKYDLPLFFSTNGWAHVLASVAEKHPGLTMIIDHIGVAQSPISPPRPDPWDRLPGLLGLARYPNVSVKLSGAPLLSSQPYPFADVWPYLHQVIEAFGPSRIMWGSDYTRLRWLPVSGALAPRSQWKLYSDALDFLRDTSEVSAADKEQMFSSTIRRVLRWPRPAEA